VCEQVRARKLCGKHGVRLSEGCLVHSSHHGGYRCQRHARSKMRKPSGQSSHGGVSASLVTRVDSSCVGRCLAGVHGTRTAHARVPPRSSPEAAHAMPRGAARAPHTRKSSLGPRCLARPPCLHTASAGADGGRVAPDTAATPCPWTTLTARVIMAENPSCHRRPCPFAQRGERL
jgi:hypothetical protein